MQNDFMKQINKFQYQLSLIDNEQGDAVANDKSIYNNDE